MEEALANAEIDPACVDLVIAHGDGTAGDRNESDAIHRLFSDTGKPIHVYSSKGALGNLLAASPVVDGILSIHMMKNGIIPSVRPMGRSEDLDHVNMDSIKAVQKSPECVMINTRGHQGQCASLVITAYR